MKKDDLFVIRVPWLKQVNPVMMQAQSHGLPALEAFAPPLISPLCCFNLQQQQQQKHFAFFKKPQTFFEICEIGNKNSCFTKWNINQKLIF